MLDRPGFHDPGRFVLLGFLTPNNLTVYFDDAVIIKNPTPCTAVFPMLWPINESLSEGIIVHVLHFM